MKEKISIIIASDPGYLCHATITIISILQNTKSNNIIFYFLDEGIGRENREYLHTEVNNLKGNIEFIAIDKEIFSNFHVSGHIKQSTYYRLIAPNLLPADIEKAIYVDSDVIVNEDIANLFYIDIENFIIAAVEESEQDSERIKKLGIENSCYFNAGIILMDLIKWRNADITKKTFQYIVENPDKLIYWDQDALNAIFGGEWYQLEAKWNVQTNFFELEKYKEVCLNPAIVHFTTDVKPWHIYSNHPFKQLYLEYREKTRWRNVPLINKELQKKLQLGSKLILFGTGSYAERIVKKLPFEVVYFIDNNQLKHGTLFLDKQINKPDEILSENKDDIAIIIASMYTKEIGNQLKKLGFEKDIHFFELHS
ncbi:glycosyltransferase family 8 protein [Lysinibacillus sp. CNPSo 3705]|uniref:glycosyltransferase family 8 protein n=1 Tax=Lysinibacillus sp. CNPSo 3705 TaxID=3028148 RepID=UPI0023642A64|nr:glycosyltransferase family 8 protein [Lysinibacillus sp. CNPSo 3705]MDD1503982.1 glycosyltransferase family 8 protein [Lysinibacillus sp. CNPSo 3705]